MNKRVVENYIPFAIEAIDEMIEKNNGLVVDQEKKILNEVFNGYIATLGASIIQSGLVPSIAFFLNENQSSEADRKLVIELVEKILRKDKKLPQKKDLLTYCFENSVDEATEDTINAAIAIKLAFRTYSLVKEE